MDRLVLQLEPRTITGKKVKNLRKVGLVPASICGKGVANGNFQLDAKAFAQVYRQAGRTALVDLRLPDGTKSAFVRQVQIHPVRRDAIHVDFRVVDLRTEMTADVPVVAVGQNPLLERGEGVLTITLPTLHLKALPTDLPQTIEIDISNLSFEHSSIHVSDVRLGDAVEVLTAADQVLVSLSHSRMEAEAEEIAEQVQGGDVELAADNADTTPDAGTSAGDSNA